MWICEDCGYIFEEPDYYTEDPSPSGVGLPAGEYRYDICPKCGSDLIGSYCEDIDD